MEKDNHILFWPKSKKNYINWSLKINVKSFKKNKIVLVFTERQHMLFHFQNVTR